MQNVCVVKDIKKNLIILFYLLLIFIASLNQAYSQEDSLFLSLRNNKVHLRQGPSFDYPIKLIYKKKFLPVEVIDQLDNWRKIKDYESNTGWIHISQLSKKRTAINNKKNSIIFVRDTIYSKPLVKLEKGRLLLIKKCLELRCKISSGSYTGWIRKENLWGKI